VDLDTTVTEIVTQIVVVPIVTHIVTVAVAGAGVAEVVEIARVGPGAPSSGVPAVRLTVPELGVTERPVNDVAVTA